MYITTLHWGVHNHTALGWQRVCSRFWSRTVVGHHYTLTCDLVSNPDLTNSVNFLVSCTSYMWHKRSCFTLSPCVVPDTPPRDFTHTVMNGAADVRFKWSPPPQGPATGTITHYTVVCDSTSGEETWISSALELTTSTLTPGTHYTCTVSASTAAGEGPSSVPIQVLTGESDSGWQSKVQYDIISRPKCTYNECQAFM